MIKMQKIVLLAILLFTYSLFSQSAGFTEGAIGINAGYTKLDMKDLKKYASQLGISNLKDDYFIYGGEILGNLTPLIQMGVKYQTCSNSASAIVDITTESNHKYKLTRQFSHSISHYDLSISYKTSISGNLEYYIAGTGGLGKTELIISQDSGDQSFGAMIDSFQPESIENSLNRSTNFSAWLCVFEGLNGVRFHLRKGVAIGFAVGYQAGFTLGDGEINHGFENIKNLPDLDFKSVKYNFGIYFGN